VTVYRAVPFMLLVAPLAIVLLAVLIGGCTMARTDQTRTDQARNGGAADRARLYAEADSRAGDELVRELKRRATREDLQRAMAEAQR
jgi:hypothetical protein